MTKEPRGAYLALVGVTVAMIVGTGLVGTLSYIAGLTGYAPLAIAFGPIALVLIVGLSARKAWRKVGFTRTALNPRTVLVCSVSAALLVPGIVLAIRHPPASTGAVAGLAALALLVAFVEETIFRGIFLRMLITRGSATAVISTSLGFMVAHGATAISPDQDALATVRTLAFALLFGVVAALLVLVTGSLLASIALHATFDFVNLITAESASAANDLVAIGIAAAVAAVLVVIHWRAALASAIVPLPDECPRCTGD